ncbi:MAG: eukaryotic-like serine/threonine-protein kinase [Thermoleophilaceae bacterium]|nr:eukaryotic-like serine/threonine-protein kinase [Thermoleophilaceae bacterium]
MEWDVEAAIEAEELEARTASEGLVLGRYRLGQRLGSGGFGTVFAARDERLRRDVAIKVIPRASTDDAHAGREARVAARLNHPSVVALYELGGDNHNVYLVSELVEGRTLGELIAEDALSDRDVARIGAALCDGLVHAHQRGVVHRDIKPQNVMVVDEPAAGMGFAKLADFGVAHLAGDEPLTRTGDVVGTLAYMAPEQAEGARVTWEADVYSLALSLYEAWTGVNPVRRRGPAATARQLGKPLPPLGRMRKGLPPELCRAVDQALDPRPERRPRPEELAVVFRELAGDLSDEGALDAEELHEGRRARARVRMPGRLFAGAMGGVLTFAVLQLFSPPTTFQPAAAAGIAAVAVALLPRLGWVAMVLTLCGWLASPVVARDGSAVMLLAACLPIPFVLPRAAAWWTLPGAAPLLAFAGAGPAYVAVAGQAPTWGRRAALGALGYLWIALAEAAVHGPLLFGLAQGQQAHTTWIHDGWHALAHGVAPAFGSPTALTAVAFAAFAALLPLLVRGVRLAADVLAAGVWAGGLYASVVGLARRAGPGTHARGAAAGAALAACVAVAAAAARRSAREPAVEPDFVP